MIRFSKLLNTDPKKFSPRVKTIIFCVFMSPIISFCILMAVKTFIRGSKSLNDLTHISGLINKTRYMKHLHNSTRYRAAYYEDVLVLSIKGEAQEFGFMENNESYENLKRYYGNKDAVVDIYYDKSGQQIEENVTLHTFDLSINDKRYINIEDIHESEMKASCVFSWIAIILSLFTYVIIMKNRRKIQIHKLNL